MKKALCLLFGMFMLMITMTGCGKSEEEKKIIGTWRHESSYVSVLTFNEDMTCTEALTGSAGGFDIENTKYGTYEIKNGMLVIYFDGNPEYLTSTKFEDDKMIWLSVFDDGVYVRQS